MDDLADHLAEIAKRQRRLGSVYKLDQGLGLDVVTVPGVDTEAMSATAIITTPAVDRVGEVVLPDGGDFIDYARNPVVLWNHGFSGLSLPIAKCETPDGQLALTVGQDAIEATSYFSPSSLESMQIFGLIAEGIIRATSIHFEPVEFKREVRDGEEVTIFTAWKMREWSWVDIGCNPEAVRKVLDRGKIGGDVLIPSIAKMLRPHAPTASKSVSKGATMPTNPTNTKPAKPTKAKADPPEDEELPDDEAVADDEADTDLADEEEKGQSPLGAQVLAAAYQGLAAAKANLAKAASMLEQPDVKGFVEVLCADLDSKIAEVEGCYSKQYPDAPALKADESEPTDAAVKRWIGQSKYKGLQLLGIAARVGNVAREKTTSPAGRKVLAEVERGLKRLHAEATAKPAEPAPQAIDPEVAKRLGALADKIAKVGEGIETATGKL